MGRRSNILAVGRVCDNDPQAKDYPRRKEPSRRRVFNDYQVQRRARNLKDNVMAAKKKDQLADDRKALNDIMTRTGKHEDMRGLRKSLIMSVRQMDDVINYRNKKK